MPGGYGYFYGSNSTFLYIVLVIPAFILSIIAQAAVKRAFNTFSGVYSKSGYSGAQAAEAVLRYYNITNVKIEMCSGKLSDHYDPRTNVIRLSEAVYSSTSIAAIGVACHEAGHAAQYANSYLPIKISAFFKSVSGDKFLRICYNKIIRTGNKKCTVNIFVKGYLCDK